MRPVVGTSPVPGYWLDQFLGRGSYGEVWRAEGPGGVPCALKFIALAPSFSWREFLSFGLVKKARHPNLCPIYAVWLRTSDGSIVSDARTGEAVARSGETKQLIIATGLGDKTLADRLHESPRGVPVAELMRYMDDAARGIDFLNKPEHDLGEGKKSAIIHCDIKPANLLVVSDGVQVCDYGVAKALSRQAGRGGVACTPAYSPVELLGNDPGPRTDQFSLAVTYFELRTGQRPLDKNERSSANILRSRLDLEALPTAERVVIARATADRPDRRFPTCRSMVEALKAAVRTLRAAPLGRAVPAGLVETSIVVSAVDTPSDAMTAVAPPQTVPQGPVPAPLPRSVTQAGRYPSRVGDYELVRLLGRGGMGAVFEARDGRLGRLVAVKLIPPERAAHPDVRARFIREARSQAMVRHDHVVPVHQVGEDGGVLFIVMPLLQGESLDRRLARPPVPLGFALRVGREVAEGLAAAHLLGLVHRDVKPSNIWLEAGPDGGFRRSVVLDFGLARRAAATDSHAITVHQALLGTPSYMSPEQAGLAAVDVRTDVYSLGVVLYQMLTGTQPFEAPDAFAALYKVASVNPPPAAEVNPDVPADLSELVARMMARDPDRRPGSAGEVAAALGRVAATSPAAVAADPFAKPLGTG